MKLAQIINLHSAISIAEQILQYFSTLATEHRLEHAAAILQTAAGDEETVAEVTWETWRYVEANKLWQDNFETLEAFKDDIGYDRALQRILSNHELLVRRKERESRGIIERWGILPNKILPAELMPHRLADHLLRALNQVSRVHTLEEARSLLADQIQKRQQDGSRQSWTRHTKCLMAGDVRAILQVSREAVVCADERQLASQVSLFKPSAETFQHIEEVDVAMAEVGKEELEDRTEDQNDNEKVNMANGTPHIETRKRHTRSQTKLNGLAGLDDPSAIATATTNGVEDMDRGDNEDEEEDEDIENGKSDEEAVTRRVLTPSSCLCPSTVAKDIQSMKGNTNDARGLQLLAKASQFGLHRVCHIHLRALAKATVGLRNNISNSGLQKRLQVAWHCRNCLDSLRRRKSRWFLKAQRPETDVDCLVVYRYHPIPPKTFQFDEARVFERFAGLGSWSTWKRDGTIIMPGLFGFLNGPDISWKINVEFDLYRYHHRSLPGRSRLGWLRNMFYSIIQQTVRQDPVWYAISTAARPDKNWRLISYPYITKDTDPGENTGFLHLDLNTTQYIKDGSGGNLLSSSIALDDEQADGCTIGVPGFHRHIHDWHKRLVKRREDTAGFTTNCSTAYRAQDRRDWGEPIPMPCPALGLRLTRPEIIHGSTPYSYRRRRSLFAWYTGIDEAHINLDLKGTLSWNDLAACHRDLEAPSREPSGQAPRYGLPGFRFPGSVITGSSSAIGDALVGHRKWTDPQVIRERDILLGNDDAAAHAYVDQVRAKMIERYEEAFEQLEITETGAFGANSYFRWKELGQPMQSDDDSEGMGELEEEVDGYTDEEM